MNVIDIIILIILAYAAYSGFKNGVVLQICSIVGLILGIWLGTVYAANIAGFLGIKGDGANLWGFFIIVLLTIILVAAISRLLKKVLSFAGLGGVDRFIGVALSLLKYLIVMSFAFTVLKVLDDTFGFFESDTLNSSPLFNFIISLSKYISPAWDWLHTQIEQINISAE